MTLRPSDDGRRPGEPVVRLRIDLAYDGTEFSGWARQPGRRTVQQVVEEALATALRLSEPAALTVAGRTDAGVHATGQVAHADVPVPQVAVPALLRHLNGLLPADIRVRSIAAAAPGFDARFAACGRRYVYRVTDATPDPLRRHDTLAWPRPLDPATMAQAAAGLVGEHDFAAYCRPREAATTVRTLRQLTSRRDTEGVILISAHADAFCHHQVRSMVGALLAVGEGRRPAGWPAEVLRAAVRDAAVAVAPAHGLTLVGVDYPPDDRLAAQVELTRRRRPAPANHAPLR